MTREGIEDERLAAYFDESPDAIVVVDTAGRIVQANARTRAIFGYDPDDLVGSPIERLVPERYRPDHPEKVEQFFTKPTARSMGAGLELEGQHADGSTFPVDVSLSPIIVAGELEVVAAVRDITYQRSLQRRYRSLLETAPDAAVVADVETGEILDVNEKATELFERPEAELVGGTTLDLHPSEDADRYRALFESHVASGGVAATSEYEGEPLCALTASGDRVPIEISANVTTINGRRVITGIFRDISLRRAHERALESQLDRVETLTHVLAHDIRNPLNVASGRVALARQTADLDHLDAVADAHTRIENIVSDALTLIRDGFDVEHVEPLELEAVATDCWQAVETIEGALVVETPGTIEADPRRIRHLFENLFRNSVEHGGADVTVTVSVTDEGFAVEDDGPGIPSTIREQIFDPGWSTNTGGTGLGLTIVTNVVAAHGWSVAVTEATEGGARFEFSGARPDVDTNRPAKAD